jgi:hypothetical protein
MDITQILAELRQEREHLDRAILTIERLALGGAKRRGRPPAWMTKATAAQPTSSEEQSKPRRGRPPGSKKASSGKGIGASTD